MADAVTTSGSKQVADMRWEMVAGSATAGDGDSVAVGDAVARRILGVDQVGVRHT